MGSKRGFTLLEILVALTISGVVVLVAHRIFTGVADGTARLAEASTALDREANARRLLTEIAGSLDVGTPGAHEFRGGRHQAAFSTWVIDARGSWERRAVSIALDKGSLVLSGWREGRVRLADSVRSLDFDYLLEPGADARWVREWISPVSAPVAMRMRLARERDNEQRVDTLLLIVGTRG